MDIILLGLKFFSDPIPLIGLASGVLFGIIFGCIPGLTATLGVILIIPFTFGMAPELGISILIGIYVGGISGGLITAILLNIPGTPSSFVTCWDGYPMSKKGLPGTALSLGVFSSGVGGMFSAFALIFIAPQLSKVALKFGSWEYFAIMILGMSVVVMMTSNNPVKGLAASCIGIILGTVGFDTVSGVTRLTFGAWQLQGGIHIIALTMGIFAVREILAQVNSGLQSGPTGESTEIKDKIRLIPPKEVLKGTGPAFILGCFYGTLMGILPGVGQGTATMLAYNGARQLSKQPEKFGTGAPEGLVASETSNNAVCGGALIPLLTLGVPGDTVTAVLIGGLMIQGIQPGPMFFTAYPRMVGAIMVAYFLANVFMMIMELGFMRIFVKISRVPLSLLFPVILLSCIFGTFSTNNRVFDVWMLVAIGVIGYFLIECDVPVPPIVLGYILGPMIEKNFRTAMYTARGNVMAITGRPVALAIVIFSVILVIWPYISDYLKRRKALTT